MPRSGLRTKKSKSPKKPELSLALPERRYKRIKKK